MTEPKDDMPKEIFIYRAKDTGNIHLLENIKHHTLPHAVKFIRADLIKEVTVEDISALIQKWRFDDAESGTFAECLARHYPNGLRVVQKDMGDAPADVDLVQTQPLDCQGVTGDMGKVDISKNGILK